MRPARLLAAVAVSAALTLVAGGCDADLDQDDDRVPRPDVVRAGLVEHFVAGSADPAVLAEGECFADGLLDRVDLDALVDAEVVDDQGGVTSSAPMLDVDVAGAWADAFLACTDYPTAAARAAGRTRDLDPVAYAACLADAVPDADLREALVDTLTGRTDGGPAAALVTAQAECAG